MFLQDHITVGLTLTVTGRFLINPSALLALTKYKTVPLMVINELLYLFTLLNVNYVNDDHCSRGRGKFVGFSSFELHSFIRTNKKESKKLR